MLLFVSRAVLFPARGPPPAPHTPPAHLRTQSICNNASRCGENENDAWTHAVAGVAVCVVCLGVLKCAAEC